MFQLQNRSEARELIGECESFLNGCFAEHLLAEGAVVPTWAWMNLLAHGTTEDLAAPPVRLTDLPRSLDPWVQARAYLAAELLDVVDARTPLVTVQRDTLIPLELAMMQRGPDDDRRPAAWVAEVTAALERRARDRRALGWA
jgi:hypothetical protein